MTMNRELDNYYLEATGAHPELPPRAEIHRPQFLPRYHARTQIPDPLLLLQRKKLAFLWVNRKRLIMGFVKDRALLPKPATGRRKDEFETIIVDPNEDIPIQQITDLLRRYMRLIP
ncbi:hypothetical protein ACQ86N_15615 [Puia sp. P3]|uniref:hypothetical protein n=1 Tax=Puia sp. P3 TaxID=3423952 RepID=UPI003D66F4A4